MKRQESLLYFCLHNGEVAIYKNIMKRDSSFYAAKNFIEEGWWFIFLIYQYISMFSFTHTPAIALCSSVVLLTYGLDLPASPVSHPNYYQNGLIETLHLFSQPWLHLKNTKAQLKCHNLGLKTDQSSKSFMGRTWISILLKILTWSWCSLIGDSHHFRLIMHLLCLKFYPLTVASSQAFLHVYSDFHDLGWDSSLNILHVTLHNSVIYSLK